MMASCVTCSDFLEWTVHKLKYFLAMGDIIARRNETYTWISFHRGCVSLSASLLIRYNAG